MRCLHISLVVWLAACNQSEFDLPDGIGDNPPPGPGSPEWGDTNLTCSTSDDCAPGETCADGTCRPKQCDDGPYESEVPLGANKLFFREQDLMIIDATSSQGSYWVDGYDAAGSIDYSGDGGGSYALGGTELVDVAALHTPSGGAMVVAAKGSAKVTVAGRTVAAYAVDTGIVPVAVAGGDVDGDQEDEIVAFSADGRVAICGAEGGCSRYSFSNGPTGKDLATADTDGDGIAEVIFLLRSGDSTSVGVWKVGEPTLLNVTFDAHFDAVTAGDLDRDGRAEVALLEDRGWFGFRDDRIHIYRVQNGFTGIVAVSTTGSAVDLASGDIDGDDGGDALVVLGDDRALDVFRWNGSSISKSFSGSSNVTSSPKRIALGDLDNDSVSARLVSGPELVAGRLLPTMVVTFPPYDATVSKELPGVGVGSRTEMVENWADTVSLRAGVEVGVDADFVGLFKAKLSTKLSAEISKSKALTRLEIVAAKFNLKPQPELYGNQYGAVVVGCNCFHTYVYELHDPANRAGGTGRQITVVVPVGGQTTVLSTPRYNALAERTQDLPPITVPSRIGDPASYPTTPTRLDGTPVDPSDLVFATTPTLRVSDVGNVGFWMLASETETNTVAMTTSVSVSGALGIAGVTIGSELGASWGNSYSITVGGGAEFYGEVPPLPDDPATPEDEYQTRAFSYSPQVYRQTYTDPVTGEPSGFYVLDYTVSAP